MKYCEECGAELEDNAEYCEECGTKQSTMQTANPIAQNESISKEKQAVSKDKKSLVIILVVVILAVLAVVVFWVISNKENSKSKDGQQTTEKDIVTNEAIVQPTEETTEEPDIQATEEPTEQPTPEPTEQPTPEPTEQPTPVPTEQPMPEPASEIDYSYLQPDWYSGTSDEIWEIYIESVNGNQINFKISYSNDEYDVAYSTNLITGMIENGTVRFYGEVFAPGIILDGEIDFPSTAAETTYFNYRMVNNAQEVVEIDTVQLWNSSQYAG